MTRPLRTTLGGLVYHVLNRANAQATLFESEGDYLSFEKVMADAHERTSVRVIAYCIMPNHWHLVLWPKEDGQLSAFMQLLTVSHTQRWHVYHRTSGTGHLYQGRFKSFPVQSNEHFLTVVRYVERNAVRANLVNRAEEWRWCSLWRRHSGQGSEPFLVAPSGWPIEPPRNWLAVINRPESPKELEAVQHCVARGCPIGSDAWVAQVGKRLGLESTFRPRGRPRKSVPAT